MGRMAQNGVPRNTNAKARLRDTEFFVDVLVSFPTTHSSFLKQREVT